MVVSSQHHAMRRTITAIMTLSEQLAGNNRTVCAQARGQQGECSAPDAQSGDASCLERQP